MTTLINLTPHEINLIVGDATITIKPEGNPLRLESETKRVGEIKLDGGTTIPLTRTEFGGTVLPEKLEGTSYIVSAMIAQAFPERSDFLIVNETVRDEQGRIVGAKSLARVK